MRRTLTNKQMDKYFGRLEDHQYRHFNESLGCYVEGKEHFRKLLAKGGYVPYELAERFAGEWDANNPRKDYVLSDKAREIIQSIKMTADRKGRIKLGSRAIEALIKMGVIPKPEEQKKILEQIPREHANLGGIS